MKRTVLALTLTLAFAQAALAENAASETQRNANQQDRVEQGLQSGQLNTKEAARLEREQTRVERTEAAAMKDGELSRGEKRVIEAEQDKASRDIYREKHDAQTGNPESASSQRMQADVQRNADQQQRIANGVKDGELTNREVANLEHGQAKVTRNEANAGADGHVGAGEQARIQGREDRQSKKTFKKKHNERERH